MCDFFFFLFASIWSGCLSAAELSELIPPAERVPAPCTENGDASYPSTNPLPVFRETVKRKSPVVFLFFFSLHCQKARALRAFSATSTLLTGLSQDAVEQPSHRAQSGRLLDFPLPL